MKFTKKEEQEARESYNKMIDSLLPDETRLFGFKGHWDDIEVKNKFNRKIIEKGDKHTFIKYYFDNKEIIEGAKNLNIEDILEEPDDYYEFE